MSKAIEMNTSIPHESAHLHVTGDATFVDDIPQREGTLFVALITSEKAHAIIEDTDFSAVEASNGFVSVLTAEDIPGVNDCAPIIHTDPILADGEVNYYGQPVFAVVADSYLNARRAARKAIITYRELESNFDLHQARYDNSYVLPPMTLTKGNAQEQLKKSECHLKGEFTVGGQEHFYLEGQIAYAIPEEDGCLQLYCSTQHPTEMQHLVANSCLLDASQVVVKMRRMGGGFGGKESQSALFCCIASVAAKKLNRPVKCRLDRDDDMMITGKRHPFDYDYQVGFNRAGKIKSLQLKMLLDSGFSADFSGPVAIRALCHVDNAYLLNDIDLAAYCCKTNRQSNTAFRGFGGPQGAFATEYIIDNISRVVAADALDVRKLNFYGKTENNMTPYGQLVDDNVIHELVDELEQSSDYRVRREQITAFNQSSTVIKKGLALTPVKFGISFNVVHFNQAGALVHIYTDGSVLVNHGGTEMGQGLNTKVAFVVAAELGINHKRVRATAADTSKVANTSATAASTGSDLNGKAAQDAAHQIKKRLQIFLESKYSVDESQISFVNDSVHVGDTELAFDELILMAYEARIQLWSDGFYKTPGLHWDKDKLKGSPFYYYAYGASVSEVAIDTLTGESRVLRADLLHDAGNSINPAIDRGQIEGAYIQGMGWLTTEQLQWNADGQLLTHAPSTYKIPAVSDCPPEFTVKLFKNHNVKDSVMRSKAVGEPPFLLGFSVFFAIRDAISSVTDYKINPPLNAPATAEEILRAVDFCRESLSD